MCIIFLDRDRQNIAETGSANINKALYAQNI